jgi:two-component system, LytTR family, response regulator
MTLNCIIVDDEPIARDILINYIAQVPYLHLVASCADAFEGMEALNKNNVDVIILDINMPRLTGFDMLRSLKKYPSVIITSAYSEYALEGFELSVTDYLLKPFSFQRFVQATEKAMKASPTPTARIEDKNNESFLMVRSDKKLTKIFCKEISYIEAYGNYIFIHRGDNNVISKQTLTEFEKQLPSDKFIRVHKSYIISLHAIKYIEGNQVSIENKNIPIGKVYRENLLRRFQ